MWSAGKNYVREAERTDGSAGECGGRGEVEQPSQPLNGSHDLGRIHGHRKGRRLPGCLQQYHSTQASPDKTII